MDEVEFERRYPNRVAATQGRATVYDCTACRDLGSEAVTGPDGTVGYRDCSICGPRKRARRQWELMQDWGIPKRLRDARFATLRPAPGLYAAYLQAQSFAADPSGLLTLIGPPGVGKSHLALAIGREACGLTQPRFVEALALLSRLKTTFSLAGGRDRDGKSFDELMQDFKTVGLLILDDLGAEQRTEFASESLFMVIQHRYNELLPTVITSNDTLDALGSRMQSRLCDLIGCRVVAMLGEDQRVRGVDVPDGEWTPPQWDAGAQGGPYHGRVSTLICPTCNSRPCLDECPRQMWQVPA